MSFVPSREHQNRRPWPCRSRFAPGKGGSLVASRPILERGGAEVFIDTTAMVAGLVVDTDENEVDPSLRSSDGGTDA